METLRTIYEKLPFYARQFESQTSRSLEECLCMIPEGVDLTLELLDSYEDDRIVSHLLGNVPPLVLQKYFGEDALYYVALNYSEHFYSDKVREQLGELLDIDPKHFTRSRNAIRQTQEEIDTVRSKGILDMLLAVESFSQEQSVAIQKKLGRKKEHFIHEPAYNGSYSHRGWVLKYDWEGDDKQVYRPYHDAPVALLIQYEEHPVAIASFTVSEPNAILIKQLQGINPFVLESPNRIKETRKAGYPAKETTRNKFIKGFPYRDYFVEAISVMAKENGFRTIGIQSYQNNRWSKPTPGEGNLGVYHEFVHLPACIGFKGYDLFALKNGFEKAKDGNFYKKL